MMEIAVKYVNFAVFVQKWIVPNEQLQNYLKLLNILISTISGIANKIRLNLEVYFHQKLILFNIKSINKLVFKFLQHKSLILPNKNMDFSWNSIWKQ